MTRVVGVVGAGTMGRGVSHAFAAAGLPVVLVDIGTGVLAAAREQIATDARLRRLVDRSGTPPAPDGVLARITFSTDPTDLAGAGYVVENITERWAAKAELYRALDGICAPDCVLAVNTSAIPITRLAGLTGRPELVVGNHFMNPAHLMPMVEVVRGLHTSEATVSRARELLARIGKECVVVNDSPGFVTNRVAMLAVNEASYLLAEGVSTAADIDHLFRRCLGHRMGPLETADLIGLDTVLYSLEVLLDEFNDPKFRPCPLLRRYVQAGWLGRKTGRGFHRYDGTAAPAAVGEVVTR
jgi:3-hydroxybutyryl-CoA dehydrogenase